MAATCRAAICCSSGWEHCSRSASTRRNWKCAASRELLSNVTQALTGGNSLELTGAGQFSVTPGGHLAYLPGPVVPYRNARLVSVDRRGTVSRLAGEPRSFAGMVRLSPDGRRLAVATTEINQGAAWVAETSHGAVH
jgi:hypothetical protein